MKWYVTTRIGQMEIWADTKEEAMQRFMAWVGCTCPTLCNGCSCLCGGGCGWSAF